jgi:hypothetical protein
VLQLGIRNLPHLRPNTPIFTEMITEGTIPAIRAVTIDTPVIQ